MKNEKHCLCCDTISKFYVYKGTTSPCCDKCNTTYSAAERKSRVLSNILSLIKPIVDVNN